MSRIKKFEEFLKESFDYRHNYNKMQINSRREAEQYTFEIIDIEESHMMGLNGRLYCIENDAVVLNGAIEWLIKRGEEMGCNIINKEDAERESKLYWERVINMKKKFESYDDEEEEEDDMLELAGLTGNFKISKEEFTNILNNNDFNDAIYHTQITIGQNDGGNAGMYFSEYSDDELDKMWSNGDREKIIIDYLKFEQTFSE